MRSKIEMGRIAGALYFAVVITGIFSLAYVPSRIPANGTLESFISHVSSSESLYRAGIAALFVNQIAFLLLPLALFHILQGTNRKAATAMVAFACAGIPVALVAASHRLEILTLVTSASRDPLTGQALLTQVDSALASYRSTMLVANLFWGLWLLPLGYLVIKSRCIPRFLGVFLILGCIGYCIDVFCTILVPDYRNSAFSEYATLPAAVGEIGAALWLLIAGAKSRQPGNLTGGH